MTLDRDSQIKELEQSIKNDVLHLAMVEGTGLLAVVGLWYFSKQSLTFLIGGMISVMAFCAWFYLRPIISKVRELRKLSAEGW